MSIHKYYQNLSEYFWSAFVFIIYNLFGIIPLYTDHINITKATYYADILVLFILFIVMIFKRSCCKNAKVVDSKEMIRSVSNESV